MLYVADFAQGRWIALDYENNPIFRDNGYKNQAEVLVRTIDAATLEDPETETAHRHPDGPLRGHRGPPRDRAGLRALTNNALHGNFYGQILRLTEKDDDPTAEEFSFEVFAAGGPQTGFASPDNLLFDNGGNLWVVTDISSSSLGSGIYATFKNNGAFVMPSGLDGGATAADVYQFASAPVAGRAHGTGLHPGRQDPLSRRPAPRRGDRGPEGAHQHLARTATSLSRP